MVTVKNAVFWDVTPCDSCKNRCFGEVYGLHHQSGKYQRARNNFSSNYHLLILSTLFMKAIRSSETSVLTRHTRRHIQEDDILFGPMRNEVTGGSRNRRNEELRN
jgi:hypothetical protein